MIDLKTNFCQDHTSCHIPEYVLFRHQRGQKRHKSQFHRTNTDTTWEFFSTPSDSQKTKPTHQTVNGRKQIICSIDRIKPEHCLIPESICHDLRPCICCREQDEKTKANQSAYSICSKKAIHLLFFLSCDQKIIDCPEQITSKINCQRPRYKRDLLIQHCFNIIMLPFGCDPILAPLYASVFHNTANKSGTIPYTGINFFRCTSVCFSCCLLPLPHSFDSS